MGMWLRLIGRKEVPKYNKEWELFFRSELRKIDIQKVESTLLPQAKE